MNLKQNSHYKEGPPQYVKVHQIFLSGGKKLVSNPEEVVHLNFKNFRTCMVYN